jgi:secreted trypsin-like serine protease
MYFAYEPQTQICTVHNGPFDRDHGLVSFLFSFERLHINYFFRSCQGDSGGGLLYFKNGRWHAAGVVSYAIGCGQQAYPTVFTKTAAYIDWIQEIINRPKSS